MVSFKLFRFIKYIDVKVHQLHNLNFFNFKIVIFQFKLQKIPPGSVSLNKKHNKSNIIIYFY